MSNSTASTTTTTTTPATATTTAIFNDAMFNSVAHNRGALVIAFGSALATASISDNAEDDMQDVRIAAYNQADKLLLNQNVDKNTCKLLMVVVRLPTNVLAYSADDKDQTAMAKRIIKVANAVLTVEQAGIDTSIMNHAEMMNNA